MIPTPSSAEDATEAEKKVAAHLYASSSGGGLFMHGQDAGAAMILEYFKEKAATTIPGACDVCLYPQRVRARPSVRSRQSN